MSTQVTPAETARHLKRLAEQRHGKGAERARQLRRLLPEAAEVLRARYGAERVVLFGSVATGTCREGSDLDLAVTGLGRDRYFDALADLMALFGAPVDLVRLEEVPDSLRQRITEEGEPL
jgi:predicted nucleotidyltransferase